MAATLFEQFVNDNLPSTLRTVIPPSGNLDAGMAMVTTGVGLNTTPKLVQTQDATMVRYVGEEPGDYATLQLALDSLPVGASDLSKSYNPYVIYIRAASAGVSYRDIDAGCICRANYVILEGIPASMIVDYAQLKFVNFGVNTFGLRCRPDNTARPCYITIKNILWLMTTTASDTIASSFNMFEIYNETNGNNTSELQLDNSQITVLGGSNYPNDIEFTVVYAVPSATNTSNQTNFSYYRGICTLVASFTTSTPAGLDFFFFRADPTTVGLALFKQYLTANSSSRISITRPASTRRQVYIKQRYYGVSSYSNTYYNLIISLNFTSGVGTPTITFMEFDINGPVYLTIIDSRIGLDNSASTVLSADGYIFFSHSKNYLMQVTAQNSTAFMNEYNAASAITGRAIIAYSPYQTKFIDNGFDYDSRALLTPPNGYSILTIEKLVKPTAAFPMADRATRAVEGKNFIIQSPLAPAAPRPGDIWIETTEQY